MNCALQSIKVVSENQYKKILNIVQYIARAGNINRPKRVANMLETKISTFWRPKYLLGDI